MKTTYITIAAIMVIMAFSLCVSTAEAQIQRHIISKPGLSMPLPVPPIFFHTCQMPYTCTGNGIWVNGSIVYPPINMNWTLPKVVK